MGKELKNLLIYHILEKELKEKSKYYLRGKLIDIGCATKPYKQLLSNCVDQHVGVDHEMTFHDKSNIDLFGTAYEIPVNSNSFDSALCTAVLEHLEEPERALHECLRVLKEGGVAIYTAPFIWHVHEAPRDFYRFSKYGLEYLFTKTGFEIIELKALSGFWVTFGQLFVYNLYRFNRGFLRLVRIIDVIGLIIQLLAFFLDKIDKSEEWTWMYLVVARKRRNTDEKH